MFYIPSIFFHVPSIFFHIPSVFYIPFIFFIFVLISIQHVTDMDHDAPSATFPAILVLPVRHFSLDMEDSNDISAACRQAADALEILSNLRPSFCTKWLNLSPTVFCISFQPACFINSTNSRTTGHMFSNAWY